jgi:hypothetical protein
MNLISSGETLDFLSKSAPRPWIKKMLLWMIFNGELEPFFEEGKSVETTSAFALIWKAAGTNSQGEERSRLIREEYDDELAEELINASDHDLIERLAHEWKAGSGAQTVAAGYFVYANSINWEDGLLEAEIRYKFKDNESLFWEDDELLQGEFEKADHNVTLRGLRFEREKIEMLQPNVEMAPATPKSVPAAAPIGRPRTWDWDGATTFLLTIAQTPDGLPTGPGAQAQIERLLADWFVQNAGKEPAESLIRKHATKIMCALKKPESQ